METEKKPETINLGDTAALKRTLDDAVIDALRAADFTVDYTYADIKIVLGASACIVGLIGQFYPGKYPDTFWILFACVSLYALLSTALTIFTMFIEKDTLTKTKGKADLIVRTSLPRYQDMYTLAVRPIGTKANSKEEVRLSESIGSYFDSNGILAADVLKSDVNTLLGAIVAESARGAAKKSE